MLNYFAQITRHMQKVDFFKADKTKYLRCFQERNWGKKQPTTQIKSLQEYSDYLNN